ncbi:MAG: hypothetical protein AB9M60_21300 [Leptothrix sp. (in: b-proteobacteria)]
MVAIEALIQEIVRTPVVATAPRVRRPLAWVAAPASAREEDQSREWYDSSYDLQTGLEVTEHHVPAALCAAVFQLPRHHQGSSRHN